MKIRYILENDNPETIEKYQKALLDANPDCTIKGINVNPIEKNTQRIGTFEADFIVEHKDEKFVQEQIKLGLKQAQDTIDTQAAEIERMNKEKVETEKPLIKRNV